MYSIVYQFSPKPGMEADFIRGWEEMTDLIRAELGGLGSRLHQTDDGTYFAYAQWPSKEHWRKMQQRDDSEQMLALSQKMKALANPSKVVLSGTIVSDLFSSEIT